MTSLDQQFARLAADIESELSSGEITFPTVFEASLRIKELADDPESSLTDIARLVQTEPVLSARVLKMANSVLLNPSGQAITAVPPAVMRIGLLPVRTLAFVTASRQLSDDLRSESLQLIASALWMHAIDVASRAWALARRRKLCAPDTALIAGMLRNIGEFYLIARLAEYPDLSADPVRVAEFVSTWRGAVGSLLLEAMGLPTELSEGIDDSALYGRIWPPRSLNDLLSIASLSAVSPNPFDDESEEARARLLEAAVPAGERAELDQLLAEAEDERREMLTTICG